MSIRLSTACAAAALLVGMATVAHAEDELPVKVTGSVAFTSDYTFRGISQTDRNPAVQGGITLTTDPGFFIGAWGSNVDFNDGDEASMELDYIVGYSGSLDALSYTAQFLYYSYPGSRGSLNYGYWEGNLGASYDLGGIIPSVNVFYTPDTFGGLDDAWYLTGGVKFKVMDNLAVYGNVGKYFYKRAAIKDAVDYNVGVTYSLVGLDFDLKWVGNNDESYGKWTKDHVVFSVTKAF
jgi:uncharacterized protein (TIGR02001 family)